MENELKKMIAIGFKNVDLNTLNNVEITPEIANQLLEFNVNNIPPQPNKIQQYAIAMEKGNWKLNGDSIRFSNDGVLLDGQNRLLASIVAKKSFNTNVVVGLNPEVFNTIDQGRVRRKGHLLAREYSSDISPQEATLISSSIMKILRHEHGYSQGSDIKNIVASGKIDFSSDDISSYLSKNPQLVDESRIVREQFGSRALLPQPTILFFMHLGNKHNKAYTARFMDKLLRGVGLYEGETLMHLNQVLIQIKSRSTRWTPTERDNTIIKVWNSIGRNGLFSIVHKGNLKIRKDDPTPFILKPKDTAIEEMLR